jgi:hypothetical protein
MKGLTVDDHALFRQGLISRLRLGAQGAWPGIGAVLFTQ